MANKNDETTTMVQGGGDPQPDGRALSPLDQRRRQQQLTKDFRGLSFADARKAAIEDSSQPTATAAEAGLGYRLIDHKEDKEHLVGVSLMVLPGWTVNPSKDRPGKYFTSCYIKTEFPVPQLDGKTEFILNDGSTGIAQQLAELRERCIERDVPDPVVFCAHGLTKSEYEVTDIKLDDKGEAVIDRRTNKPIRVPRIDPITQQPVGMGATYYLDTTD